MTKNKFRVEVECPFVPGLCRCGCGYPTSLSDRNDSSKGLVKGQPRRYIHGHQARKYQNNGKKQYNKSNFFTDDKGGPAYYPFKGLFMPWVDPNLEVNFVEEKLKSMPVARLLMAVMERAIGDIDMVVTKEKTFNYKTNSITIMKWKMIKEELVEWINMQVDDFGSLANICQILGYKYNIVKDVLLNKFSQNGIRNGNSTSK